MAWPKPIIPELIFLSFSVVDACSRTFKGDFGKLCGWLAQGASYPCQQERGAGSSPAAGCICGERRHTDVSGLPLWMPRGLAGAAAGKVRWCSGRRDSFACFWGGKNDSVQTFTEGYHSLFTEALCLSPRGQVANGRVEDWEVDFCLLQAALFLQRREGLVLRQRSRPLALKLPWEA